MKLIIAGSRNLNITSDNIYDFISCLDSEINEVVCGCARGVDKAGERWANKMNIPIKHFPADWGKYGKSAGYHRNVEMAEYADALLLIWDGSSKGSKHMKEIMEGKGKPVHLNVVRTGQEAVK